MTSIPVHYQLMPTQTRYPDAYSFNVADWTQLVSAAPYGPTATNYTGHTKSFLSGDGFPVASLARIRWAINGGQARLVSFYYNAQNVAVWKKDWTSMAVQPSGTLNGAGAVITTEFNQAIADANGAELIFLAEVKGEGVLATAQLEIAWKVTA